MTQAQNSAALNQTKPFTAMVFGASGGIGHAMVLEILKQHPDATVYRFARHLERLAPLNPTTPGQILDVLWDLNAPEALAETLTELSKPQASAKLKIDFIFLASGFLHDETQQPEKSYQQLKPENLMRSFALNAVGPVMVLQTLLQHLDLKHPCKMGVLSARVGSISDNRKGGWHSYRASKAAMNMLLKNLAIELQRKRAPITLVGLQPGTTDTALSKPFTKNLTNDQLQSPAFTAENLWHVLQELTPEDSGQLFDFKGESFEP
ncbi:SDR family NAD(P)-dependent oxidoreductase [Thiosulfativibrio zosterae]|uniref:SDR family oxidoreductase n=1 Tax=Thiosulfativibrio zosterae TaxID=2675053 RepID=A0A6F8PRB0_9GAMM|nr:SDR family NAD(P)-dependent oxidoreductase [Thiosulfativibrio zosterae]BBP44567.1 SDR family oxidoreductase [Thiosulfativibrio zosterae]